MSKYYTLEEAFDKRLLLDGEYVDGTALYKPTKVFLEYSRNEDEVFYKSTIHNYVKKKGLEEAIIYRNSEQIYMKVYTRMGETARETGQKIADKYFSILEYNITATYNPWGYCYIHLDSKILVHFDSKEYPILELPSHIAYTC